MDDVALMEVMQAFEDLDNVTCDKTFVEPTECLDGLTQRPVLSKSKEYELAGIRAKE